jgi:hypothetical protein
MSDESLKRTMDKWKQEKLERRKGPSGTNLQADTLDVLHGHNKTAFDVRWVGSFDFGYCTWDEFVQVAKDDFFYSGFGAPEVATDLIIAGDTWWLERHEYDGSEWFEFKEMPRQPQHHTVPITFVIREDQIGWRTLAQIHDTEE